MIETSRLFISQPQNKDILAIENLWRDTKIRQFLGGIVSDNVIKDKINVIQKHWELHKFGQWVVFEKNSNEIK